MNKGECREGLIDLMEDRKSFITEGDSIFKYDIKVIRKDIELIDIKNLKWYNIKY